MRCCLGFLAKAMRGGKFDSMLCLEVLINGFKRFIYLLFQMSWWKFGRLCVTIHLYFQGFTQGIFHINVVD